MGYPRALAPTFCVADMKANHLKLQPVRLSTANRLMRIAWSLCWAILYRPSPVPFHAWRRALLRAFGARIAPKAKPYPSARVWAPWNLEMGEHSCLAHGVDCYCVASVSLGPYATVSQYSYLCSASHDYRSSEFPMPLEAAPIRIGANAWVAADVFVGPGVSIGAGVVVGARSTVLADIPEWTVVAGSPPRQIGTRPQFSRDAT